MPYREFTDGEGRLWRAWDTVPEQKYAVPPQYAQGWLCFESEAGKRRLAPVPPGWDQVPEERLRMFLQVADEAGPSRIAGNGAAPEPPAGRR